MSKELEALEKLAKQVELDEDTDFFEIRNAYKTVEEALIQAQKHKDILEIIESCEIMEKMTTTPIILKLDDGNTVEKSFKHHQILYNPPHRSIDIYMYEFECSLPMKDYKKTWWLKGDM